MSDAQAPHYINPIIQSWIHANKNKRDSEEAIAQQKLQREAQVQADKHFQTTHDLEKSRFEAEQKYREAQQLMNQAQMRAQGAQHTTENVASGAVSPTENTDTNAVAQNGGILGGAGNFPSISPDGVVSPGGVISHSTPSIDPRVLNQFTTATAPNSFDGSPVNVPTPAQIGQNKLAITDPIAQRTNEQAIKMEGLKTEAENQKIAKQGENSLAVAGVNAASRKYVSDQSYKGLIEKAHLDAAGRIKAAMQKSGAQEADTSFLAPEVLNGSVTLEDLPKMGVAPKDRLKLTRDITASGGHFLNKEQKAFALAGGAIRSFRDALGTLNDAYKKAGMLSLFDPDVKNAEKEVKAQLGNVARVIGGERGTISNQDTSRAMGFAPDAFNAFLDKGKRNDIKIEQFDKILDNRFNTLFGNMGKEQREIIRGKWQVPTSQDSKQSSEGSKRLTTGEIVDAEGNVTGRWK